MVFPSDKLVMMTSSAASVNLLVILLLSGYVLSDCPLPDPLFPDGDVTVEDGSDDLENLIMAEDMTILRFACSDGYSLFGDPVVQCLDEEWEGEWPFCAENTNKCSKPPIVENAELKLGYYADPVIGSIAKYSCKPGYELSNPNSSVLQCSMNRENQTTFWDGETPVCRKKTECNDPGSSPDGKRLGSCCLSGDTLRFSCNESYELVGEAEIRCLKTGQWSSRRPRCRPLHSEYCEFPEPIPHAMLNGSRAGDYFVPGEMAEVWCKPGYRCESNDVVECLEGGIWDKEFGVCKEIFCDPPPPVAHGKILELQTTNLTKFPFNYDINYVCDEGYRIVRGDSWRMCIKSGVWSGVNTICEEIRCPDPGTPDNGIKSSSDYSVGSRIRFSCYSGYELLGEQEIICQGNGEWAGELARCNLPSNYCPDPGTPIRGSRNRSTFEKGDMVHFKCDPGTFLVGSKIRECLPDRTWSGTPTKCVAPYDFDNAGQVRDRLLTRMAEIREEQEDELQRFEKAQNGSFGRAIDFKFPGRIVLYFAFDVSGSIPVAKFEESIEFAKAIVREVGVSEDGIRVGALTFANVATGIFLPLNYDTVDDVLNALDDLKGRNTGGGTSASSALNFIRTEYIPVVEEQLKPVKVKSIIFILTDGRANMGGSPKNEADILKSNGVEIYCVGITGNSMKQGLYDIASQTTYGEDTRPNVFMLQDYGTLAWLVQEITYGTANYSQCGLGKEPVGSGGRIVGGSKVVDPWPWMAALYMNVTGKSPEEKELVCGGSIIHPYFILTAAHCMYYDEAIPHGMKHIVRKERDIIVKLGLTDVKKTTHIQELVVRKIITHEKFRFATYDYDVALLELKENITYNAFVRPICLPPKEIPEDNPFYKPDSMVWLAGWGHTDRRKKHDPKPTRTVKHLKEISLPIQTRETCKESLSDDKREFTDRMFCAGTGGVRNDSCKGDSGGPVMERHLNKAGYQAWTQVGLVSWGIGCGLENEYGMYVRLQNVMPWVEKTIKDAENWRKER